MKSSQKANVSVLLLEILLKEYHANEVLVEKLRAHWGFYIFPV